MSQFAGYRRVANYGWLRKISQAEYESDESWEYADCDEHDLFIIAHNVASNEYAWVEGSASDA